MKIGQNETGFANSYFRKRKSLNLHLSHNFQSFYSFQKTKKSEDSDDSTKPVAATATASKLKGILEVRLKKGAPTQIRKLRVFPPKSVKVNGTAGSSGSTTTTTGGGKRKPQQYGKVTPMATARLRQVASTVVKQTDSKRIQPPISK